ncbi:hypothetical protein EJB05_29062, partial [Eragrostis curvula]
MPHLEVEWLIRALVNYMALDKLETLEIMWCGDLSVAFDFYDTPWKSTSQITWRKSLKLKHIWLHEATSSPC